MPNTLSSVKDWLYHLGDIDGTRAVAIKTSGADMVITEYGRYNNGESPYTSTDLNAMRENSGSLVVSYLSIGEAEDYRYYWQSSWSSSPPAFMDKLNPEWEGNFKVKYWDPAWQKIIFGYVDRIVGNGFNGLYLDIVEAYEYWEEKAPNSGIDYRKEMAEFVADIRARAEAKLAQIDPARKFVIIGQNGEELILNSTYLNAIDGVASEDIRFYYEYGNEGGFQLQSNEDYQYRLDLLKQAEAAGKETFVVEYLTAQRQQQYSDTLAQEIAALKAAGIPFYISESRDLNKVYSQPGGNGSSTGNDVLQGTGADDVLDGGAGHDKLFGANGNDNLRGGNGNDILLGEAGNDILRGGDRHDKLNGGNGADVLCGDRGHDVLNGANGNDLMDGGSGNDTLIGGRGNDRLNGGQGKDIFVFGVDWGNDVIRDFAIGADHLSVQTSTSYDVTATANGILLTYTNGHSIELTGIALEDFSTAFFS